MSLLRDIRNYKADISNKYYDDNSEFQSGAKKQKHNNKKGIKSKIGN